MSILETIADDLAKKALEIILEEDDDDRIVGKMAEALANSSPTLEEAFLAAVRFRRGEHRALQVLKAWKSKPEPAKPAETNPDEASTG